MKNKVKTIIIAGMFTILGCVLGACGTTASAQQDYPLKIWRQNENGMCKTWNVVDEDTGVNYVVVTTSNSGNSASYSVAITPRLNADGTLYVTYTEKRKDL